MKLSGTVDLSDTPEAVFARLLNRDLLQRCIPGCKELVQIEERRFKVVVKAGVGAIRGTFKGDVELHDVELPESYRMTFTGKSTVGHAKGGASTRLEAIATGTRVHYEGEAKVSGMIAAVGGRLIEVAARKVAQDFFDKLAAEIASAD